MPANHAMLENLFEKMDEVNELLYEIEKLSDVTVEEAIEKFKHQVEVFREEVETLADM